MKDLVPFDIQKLKFMDHIYTSISNIDVLLCRCGYTGEDGFEISVDTNDVIKLADILFKNELVKPAG